MMTTDRDNLLDRLADDRARVAAAETLLASGVPLTGPPPTALIDAVARGEANRHQPLLDLARAWSRPEMSRAALDAFHAAGSRQREEFAWLLKTVLAPEDGPEVIALVHAGTEEVQVRRWLIEALERLVRADALGWAELGGVVEALSDERAASLREALASLLMTLPWRAGNLRRLAPLLRDPDPMVVAAAANALAGHPDAVRQIDHELLDDLRRHPHPLMSRAAAVLDAALGGDMTRPTRGSE